MEPLRQAKCTEDREINVLEAGAAESVSGSVSVHRRTRGRIVLRERRGIDPALNRTHGKTIRTGSTVSIADQLRAIVGLTIKIGVDSIAYGEGNPRAIAEDRCDGPAIDRIFQEAIVAAVVVGLVNHRNHCLMTEVEVGRSAIELRIAEIFYQSLGSVVIELNAVEGLAVHVPGVERYVMRHPLHRAHLQAVVGSGLVRAQLEDRAEVL